MFLDQNDIRLDDKIILVCFCLRTILVQESLGIGGTQTGVHCTTTIKMCNDV